MSLPVLTYEPDDSGLNQEIRRRVDAWFTERGIHKYANTEMHLKAGIFIVATVVFYLALLFAPVPPLVRLVLWSAFGFAQLSLCIGIAHDCTHNAYFRSKRLNALGSRVFDVLGFSSYVWDFNHMAAHHSGPNVGLWDAAIASGPPIRLHDRLAVGPLHRIQHLSFPLLYGFASLYKLLVLDFMTLAKSHLGATKLPPTPPRELVFIALSKVNALVFTLLIPMLLVPDGWPWVLVGFVVMHMTAGIGLGTIFQVTHLHQDTTFVTPDERGRIDAVWIEHNLATTADFARHNRLALWICGGLNIHITHHLLPDICHIHLIGVSEVVKQALEEHGYTYVEYPTVGSALVSHARLLRRLGQPEGPFATSAEAVAK